MKLTPVTHYFTFLQSLGGVQSLLRRHLENDDRWGLDSDVAAFFDPPKSDEERVRGLGLSWRSTVWSSRAAFRKRLTGFGRPMAVYNNFWGVPFFADLDHAERRVAVLHSYAPVLGNCLDAEDGLVDGVLCVSRPLKEVVYRHLPSLEKERVVLLPLPIASSPVPVRPEPLRQRPLVIGMAGRLQKEQKRVDLLPAVVGKLEEAGLDFRLELLGSGPSEGWLKRQFAGNERVTMLGHRTGDAYWKTLSGWDAILFTSDYEGLPLALLEAMSVGVLPVYPRIDSGGDSYVSELYPDFLYPPGDSNVSLAVSMTWRQRAKNDGKPGAPARGNSSRHIWGKPITKYFRGLSGRLRLPLDIGQLFSATTFPRERLLPVRFARADLAAWFLSP